MLPEAFQKELDKIRQEYDQELPLIFSKIENAWQELKKEWNEKTLQKFYAPIHKLAGSAGSFGYTELGEAAHSLELSLKPFLNQESPSPTPVLIENIQKHLTEFDILTEPSFYVREVKKEPEINEGGLILFDEKEKQASSSKKNVFLLSKDEAFIKNVRTQISTFDYVPHFFSSWMQIKQELLKSSPDCLILDLDYLDQFPAKSEINLPTMFISSHGDFKSRLVSARAGGFAYLTKPFHITELLDHLDYLFNIQNADPYRILLIDDDLTLSQSYALNLRQAGMETQQIQDPRAVMQSLVEFKPDLILLDLYMDSCNGFDLAQVIRQQEAYAGTPIVFLSTEANLEKQGNALKQGGDDFLTKPIDAGHLVSAVKHRAERGRILRSHMIHDGLTGLLNHSALLDQLEIEIARAKRRFSSFVFAMIDLDHFKEINDKYGHSSGDIVLKNLSRLLRQRLRKSDIIGRYGGEEFALILADTDLTKATQVLNEIRETFSKIKYFHATGEFSATFSGGLAAFPTLKNSQQLNEAADLALYRAKEQGRNRVLSAS